MENLPLTLFDIILLVVVLVSAAFAYFRGFISEILGMVAWGGAIFTTLYGLPLLRPYVRPHIRPDALADTVLVLSLAIVSLIVFKLIAGYIGDRARQSRLGALDRSLGVLFGLFRGLLVVCIAYIMISWIIPRHRQPDWIQAARMRPLVEYGSNFIRSLLPAEFAQHIGPYGNDKDVKDVLKDMKRHKGDATSGKTGGKGYDQKTREDLDQLIKDN